MSTQKLTGNFWTLILLIFAITISGCSELDPDDQSLVTGDCELTGIQGYFDPNPATITPGSSIEVVVDIGVESNCNDYVNIIWITNANDYTNTPISSDYDVIGNAGHLILTISVSENITLGVHERQYKIHATTADIIGIPDVSAVEVLEYHVVAPPQADFEIDYPQTLELLEGIFFLPISMTVFRVEGHNSDIHFDLLDLPPHVTFSFDPNPVPENVSSVDLIIFADYPSVPGEYPISLTANDGTIEKTYPIYFKIRNQYLLELSQDTIYLAPDTSAIVTVDIDWGHSEVYNEMVFDAQGSIIGQGTNLVEAEFNPNPVPWGQFSTVLTLSSGQDVIPGTNQVIISGANENLMKEVVLTIIIEEE